MKKLILLLAIFAGGAFAQCGPNGTFFRYQGSPMCIPKTGASGYIAPFSAVTGLTVTAATHGQGTTAVGFCFDNSTPANAITESAGFPTVAANGDIVFAWSGSKIGYCIISALGSATGPTGAAGPAPSGSGIVKVTGGVASVATANTDYQAPLTFVFDTNVTAARSGASITFGWQNLLAASRGGLGADASGFAGIIKMTGGVASGSAAIADLSDGSHVVKDNANSTMTGFYDLHTGQVRLPELIAAQLPSASTSTGKIYIVTDGQSATDCANGGGSTASICRSNGASWVAIGGSGGGGGGGVTTFNTRAGAVTLTNGDVLGTFTGTCNSSTFLRGDGTCNTPAGGGNVSAAGMTAGTLPVATSATTVSNSNVSQDGITGAVSTSKGFNAPAATVAYSATPTFDLAQANRFELTLAGNVTNVTIQDKKPGAKFSIAWKQPGGGGQTVSYNGASLNACNVLTQSSATTVQQFEIAADGSTVQGTGCASDVVGLLAFGGLGAEPTQPTSGNLDCRLSSADTTVKCEDSSGNIYVLPRSAGSRTANQFITYCDSHGICQTAAIAAGDLPAVAMRTDQSNVISTGNQDFSAASSLEIPVLAGGTSGVDGRIVYDSTNKNTHIRANSGDGIAGAFLTLPVNGHCVQSTVSAGSVTLADSGNPCGTGSGGGGGGSYSQAFTSVTTLSLTHNLGSTAHTVSCFDGSNNGFIPGNIVYGANTDTLTFSPAQPGTCIAIGGTPGGGGGGGSSTAFSNSASVSVNGLGTKNVTRACYDNNGVSIEPDHWTISGTAPYNVTATFTAAATGTCVITGMGKYVSSLQSGSTWTITGATNAFATAGLTFSVFDNSTIRRKIEADSITVDPSNFNVVATFAAPQTGYLVIE